jgi:hypothetical protein
MLVLNRKVGDSIRIGSGITLKILRIELDRGLVHHLARGQCHGASGVGHQNCDSDTGGRGSKNA